MTATPNLDHRLLKIFEDPEDVVRLLVVQPTLDKTLELSEAKIVSLFEVGVKAHEDRCYDKAIDTFTFLTSVRPSVPNFWIGLGRSLHGIGRYSEAVQAYKLGICLGAASIEPYVYVTQCLVELDAIEEAEYILEVALEASVDNHDLHQDLMATRAYARLSEV